MCYDDTLLASRNMLQIFTEDVTEEHECTLHTPATDADGSLSDPQFPTSQDNEMWLVLYESASFLATTAIADVVGMEVENRKTSSAVNCLFTLTVLHTGYDMDTCTYPKQRDQQEMTISNVLSRHLTFDNALAQKNMAVITHKMRFPNSERVSATARIGFHVTFRTLLKRMEKGKSIVAPIKLNHNSESATPGHVKIKLLKQTINRNKCVTSTRWKPNIKNKHWSREVATCECRSPHKHPNPKIQLV